MKTNNFFGDNSVQGMRAAYTPPTIEIVDVALEHGFAQSSNSSNIDDMGEDPDLNF
jgi:hypothetical protein